MKKLKELLKIESKFDNNGQKWQKLDQKSRKNVNKWVKTVPNNEKRKPLKEKYWKLNRNQITIGENDKKLIKSQFRKRWKLPKTTEKIIKITENWSKIIKNYQMSEN